MRIVKLKGMRQINGLHYAPDGRRLLAVGGHEVRSVDEARWVDVVEGTKSHPVPLYAFSYAVSPDLKRMALGIHQSYQDMRIPVVVFDPDESNWREHESRWREVPLAFTEPGTRCEVHALAFAPTGGEIALSYSLIQSGGNVSVALRFLQVGPLNLHQPFAESCSSAVTGITFASDGQSVATLGGVTTSAAIAIRSADTLAVQHSFTAPTNQTRQILFSPDGDTLAVANTKAVLLLPPDLSAPRVTLAHPKQVNAVAFTPDGRRVLTTCTDKLVRVWDATTGQLVTSYDWNVGVTNAIAVAPDGLTAAVSGQSGRVVLFDLEG